MRDLWVPLSGAISQQRKIDTLANNIANANTPGFKKDHVSFKEHLTVLEKGHQDIDLPNKEWKPEDFYKSYDAENAYVKVAGSFTDFKQGSLVPTNNPLDLAIKGKGFFEVLTPNGVRYTRQGIFSPNKDGNLVTNSGNRLLSELEESPNLKKPEERVIKIPSGQVVVTPEGEVHINKKLISKISLVEFKDIHALRKEGNSLFINKDIKNISNPQSGSAILQGFVEQSNVNPVGEISELLKTYRHFESLQRAIKTYDNIGGRAVNDIAKF
jgi:flagellar basal-body rod protein FlgF